MLEKPGRKLGIDRMFCASVVEIALPRVTATAGDKAEPRNSSTGDR